MLNIALAFSRDRSDRPADRSSTIPDSSSWQDDVLAKFSFVTVWGVYVGCLAVAFHYVQKNAVNVPFGDDHYFAARSMGLEDLNWSWLWSQHNEHRLPFPRIILLFAAKFSGNDFRAGCYVVLGMLASLAAVLIQLARRIRGYTLWADAIFPIACLHLGHCENLLWSFQVQFAGSVLLVGLLLTMLLRHSSGPSTHLQVLLMGCCALILIGFGANGIAFVPFVAVWMLFSGLSKYRSGSSRAIGLHMMLWSIGIAACTLAYFVGLQKYSELPPPGPPRVIFDCTTQFLSHAAISYAQQFWPDDWTMVGYLVPSALAITSLGLVFVVLKKPTERHRAFALLLMIGGMVALAGGIAWGRSGFAHTAGFSQRYVTLSTPSIFLAYFSALLFTAGRRSELLQSVFLGVTVFAYLPNYDFGEFWVSTRIANVHEYEQDLKDGVRAAELADRFADERSHPQRFQVHHSPHTLAYWILGLRRVGVGPFQPARSDGASRVEDFEPRSAEATKLKWDAESRIARDIQVGSRLTFPLAQPKYVQRVYLIQTHQLTGADPASVRVFLIIPSTNGRAPQVVETDVDAAQSKVKVKVDRVISSFYLQFDAPPKSVKLSVVSMITGSPESQ